MTEHPLARETKRAAVAIDEVEPDGTFTGYASLFGRADMAGDLVEPGAFSRSLKARGLTGVKMLWQHDPAEPIGFWSEIGEDRRGLRVTGRLMPELERAREVLALMRAGAVDGLSIGFRTVKARADRGTGIRHLIEVDLWEISVVTFPMLNGARIASVKHAPPARSRSARRSPWSADEAPVAAIRRAADRLRSAAGLPS